MKKTTFQKMLLLTFLSLFFTNLTFSQSSIALVHGNNGTEISGWLSNGDGTFETTKISIPTAIEFGFDDDYQTFFADVNNDTFVDIVHATEVGGNQIKVYLNNADNTFSAATTTTGFASVGDGIFAGQAGNQQGWLADVNANGNLDYVFSGDDDNIHVFSGNGDGTFSTTAVTTSLSDSPSTYGTMWNRWF